MRGTVVAVGDRVARLGLLVHQPLPARLELVDGDGLDHVPLPGPHEVDPLQRVNTLMARQGHMIETVAINQLEARRERLVAQQTQARYAVADSYDRASRAQSGAEER